MCCFDSSNLQFGLVKFAKSSNLQNLLVKSAKPFAGADSGAVESRIFCKFVLFLASKTRSIMYEYEGLQDVIFIAFLLWRVETLEELEEF